MAQPINMEPHLCRVAGQNHSVGILYPYSRHTLPILNEYA